MSDKTRIQWADSTWNPMTGCTPTSEACEHCYAKAQAHLHEKAWGYGFDPMFHPTRLDKPLHWRKPRRIFVCSMSDLFHEAFTDEQIDRVWEVMTTENHAKAGSWNGEQWTWYPHHTFMVLTKRPGRMRDYVLGRQRKAQEYADRFKDCPTEAMQNSPAAIAARQQATEPDAGIWLGVTAENEANRWRLDFLKDTPAAVRFVSYEPALGPFGEVPAWLDWFICGPETGPGKRLFSESWALKTRHQCKRLGISYFDKRDAYADWREFPQVQS
jgi:protein gp37